MKRKYWFLASLLVIVSIALAGIRNNHSTLAQEESSSSAIEIRPSNITNVMNAFLADKQAPQDLSSTSLTPCVGGTAAGYPCNNIDLLAFMPLATIGGGNGNDSWGWTDPLNGKEYAIMGRSNGTAFIDISDPVNPLYLGNLPTHTGSSSWRDIKTYANHAFVVSDNNGSHGMQVFNLTQLRNVVNPPVTFGETAHYNGVGSAHNMVINEDTGYGFIVGASSCSGGLHMVNIQNPTSPTFAGCYSGDGYTHDAQCVTYNGPDVAHQGQEICMNSNEDTLTIVDVTNKAAPVQLARTGYTGSEYTHQGWFTEDQVYFLLDDELDESRNGHNTRTYIWNVSDLDNPVHIGTYTAATTNIDHNQYIKGNFSYQANYRAGLRILDISNIANANLNEVAYFDIYPSSNSANFNGAWNAYPYFASGVVIVSGIEQGLFILQPNLNTGPTPTPTNTPIPPTPTNTPVPSTPTNTPAPGSSMHVGDLDGSSTINGGRWDAHVLITIHNGNENPVANATVSGSWSNGANGSGNCLTNGSGQCTITASNLKNNVSQATFTVNNVTHTTNLYQSGSNHDPDGDSNGTSIIVFRDGSPQPTATSGPTATPNPTATPGPSVVMHVGDLDGSTTSATGNRWSATVLITVHNASDNLVANATVNGTWNSGVNGTTSCVTNASGQCSVDTNNLKGNVPSATFTVNNVSLAGSTYNPGANHDPDGDSNGTAITILQP